MDAVEATVGDRARVRDREPARAGAAADDAGRAVPDDPGPQLGELVGRVAAGEHVEHVLELLQGEVGERIGAADQPVQRRHFDLLLGDDRDDLLSEHVERVPRDPRLLDLTAAHRLRDDGRLEQVGAELREDAALRGRAELVAGAADALQAARDRLRALDLDHEVDGAHVDPELEAGGRDQARDPARLQILLDQDPLLARQRAVVCACDLFLGQLVQPNGEPLREAPVVDEDDRRAVLPDELEDGGVDRGPDRAGRRLVARRHHDVVVDDRLGELERGAELAQVLDRDDDLEVELLARPGVDELDRAVAGDEPADLLERALRRREADPLRRLLEQRVEPLQRERQVGAALGAGDGVHLVDDHGLDPAERLARLRGQHQEERLRRRDQDVGRLLHELAPLLLGRVARADADAEVGLDPGERPAQVPLDVVVERLQRRDVEQAQARPGAADRACRSRAGRRRASCRSRSAPGSARARRRRSPASLPPAPGSARRTPARTSPASCRRTAPADPCRQRLASGALLTHAGRRCSVAHMAKKLTNFLIALNDSVKLRDKYRDPEKRDEAAGAVGSRG